MNIKFSDCGRDFSAFYASYKQKGGEILTTLMWKGADAVTLTEAPLSGVHYNMRTSRVFEEMPVVLSILAHTGLKDGDDGKMGIGYRDVEFAREDDIDTGDPDGLVVLNEQYECHPIYATGGEETESIYYKGGTGASPIMAIRRPVERQLQILTNELAPYDRRPLIWDAFRSSDTQRRTWVALRSTELFPQVFGDRDPSTLSVLDEVKLGRMADDGQSFVALLQNERYFEQLATLKAGPKWDQVEEAAAQLGEDVNEVALSYLTFEANQLRLPLDLDPTAENAHAGGGALDMGMIGTNGKIINIGCAFDDPKWYCAFDALEAPEAFERFQESAAKDPIMKRYLRAYGIPLPPSMSEGLITRKQFDEIVRNRRIMFHATRAAGFTIYSGECFHFNGSNVLGGKQANIIPASGNGPQALLRNARRVDTGKLQGNWTNRTAHAMYAKLLESTSMKKFAPSEMSDKDLQVLIDKRNLSSR